MRPNKEFKLSKYAKTQLAFVPTNKYNMWKKVFIEKELCEKAARAAKYKEPKGDE